MKTLAVVPARGGSKGLPGKNGRPFLGVSLLERAFRVASESCDDVVITTDAPELAELAWNAGAGYRHVHYRPHELATDDAPILPVVQDAIRGREGDVIVLLQPTQPMRTVEHVQQALRALASDPSATSVVTVKRVPAAYVPDRVLHLEEGRLFPATREGMTIHGRQAARPAYVRDGAVYAIRREAIESAGRGLLPFSALLGFACRPLILPGDALSIDTLEDFERLEALARAQEESCPTA